MGMIYMYIFVGTSGYLYGYKEAKKRWVRKDLKFPNSNYNRQFSKTSSQPVGIYMWNKWPRMLPWGDADTPAFFTDCGECEVSHFYPFGPI